MECTKFLQLPCSFPISTHSIILEKSIDSPKDCYLYLQQGDVCDGKIALDNGVENGVIVFVEIVVKNDEYYLSLARGFLTHRKFLSLRASQNSFQIFNKKGIGTADIRDFQNGTVQKFGHIFNDENSDLRVSYLLNEGVPTFSISSQRPLTQLKNGK